MSKERIPRLLSVFTLLLVLTFSVYKQQAFCGQNISPEDTIKIGLSAGLNTLDPSVTAYGPDMNVVNQISESLLEYDPGAKTLKPRLATSWKTVNATTWEFKLRKGVRFTNGEPFNSEVVKFSIERVLDPKTNSQHRSRVLTIDHVQIVDDHTVNIITKKPTPTLPLNFQPLGGTGRIKMVPPRYIKEKGGSHFAEHPIGTGPYKLVEWDKGRSVTLEVNEDYWAELPVFKKAMIYFIPEASTRVAALLSGEVDIIMNLPFDEMERVTKAAGVRVSDDPNYGLVQVFFVDPSHKPLDDVRVRKAVSYCINMQPIIEGLLHGLGHECPVPVAPTVLQYDDSLEVLPYDPDKARKLLEEAGYGEGFSLETYMSEGRYTEDKATYEVVNAQLKKCGIRVNARLMEFGRLIGMMAKGTAGPFYMIGWDFSEGDAAKLTSLFHSKATYSLWSNPHLDELLDKAATEMDQEKRKELYCQAQKLIVEERMFLRAWQASTLWGVNDRIDWEARTGNNFEIKNMKKAQ